MQMHSAQPGQLAGTAPSMLQNLTLPFRGLLAGQYVKDNFIEEFESEWGEQHPPFFKGAYADVVSYARSCGKLLVVYLHSAYHINTPLFARDILCKQEIIALLSENFVCWGVSISSSEGYRAMNLFNVPTFPFIAVVDASSSQSSVVDRIEGLISQEHLTSRLLILIERYSSTVAAEAFHRQEREDSRRILQAQDEEYEASLAADREKQRRQQEEQRRREEEERAEEIARKQKEERLARKRQSLPPEPSDDTEEICHIMVRLPSGSRVGRKFLNSCTLQDVYDFVDTAQSEVGMDTYLLASSYPRKEFDNLGATLQSLGFGKQMLLDISAQT